MNSSDQRTDSLTVEVESVLEPIVPDFLANRSSDCELIRQLLDTGAFAEIRTIGHRMKGGRWQLRL